MRRPRRSSAYSNTFKKIVVGKVCHYCKLAEATTLDHKIPLIRGGTHIIENLLPACEPCNSAKSDMKYEVFVRFVRRFGSSFHPQWFNNTNYSKVRKCYAAIKRYENTPDENISRYGEKIYIRTLHHIANGFEIIQHSKLKDALPISCTFCGDPDVSPYKRVYACNACLNFSRLGVNTETIYRYMRRFKRHPNSNTNVTKTNVAVSIWFSCKNKDRFFSIVKDRFSDNIIRRAIRIIENDQANSK